MGALIPWARSLGRRWWILQLMRVAVALGTAVAVHGLSDSTMLAVVALFVVIGVSESAIRGPASPRPGPSPWPIPRHPLIALACGAIATASWAITHYALHGHGQELAPAIVYLAGIYVWMLQDWARDRDADSALERPDVAGEHRPDLDLRGS